MREANGRRGPASAAGLMRSPAPMAALQVRRARELRVLDMLAQGASADTIAEEEGLSASAARALVNELRAARRADGVARVSRDAGADQLELATDCDCLTAEAPWKFFLGDSRP